MTIELKSLGHARVVRDAICNAMRENLNVSNVRIDKWCLAHPGWETDLGLFLSSLIPGCPPEDRLYYSQLPSVLNYIKVKEAELLSEVMKSK